MPDHPGGAGTWPALLLVVAAAVAYGWAVRRLRRRGDRWPWLRTAAAGGGLLVTAAALLPPLATTMDFRQHVVLHLLLSMLGPLLVALAAPMTLALRTLPRRPRARLLDVLHSRWARVVTCAPVVLVLEVGGMYAYYLTPLYGFAHVHTWAYVLVHVHMFLAGYLFSAYVVARDPMPNRPGPAAALTALLVVAAGHDVLAKLMYARGLPVDAAAAPQLRTGAQLMFYGGDVVDVLLAVAVMAAWYAGGTRELRRDRRRAPTAARPGRPTPTAT